MSLRLSCCGTVSVSDLWPVSPLKTCCNLDNTCSPVCVCLCRHQDSTFMLNWGDEESAHACVRVCSRASYLLFNFLWRTNRSSVRWKSKQEVDEKLTDFFSIKDHFTVTTNTDIISISSDTSIQDTIETSLHHAGWSFSWRLFFRDGKKNLISVFSVLLDVCGLHILTLS